MDRGVAARLRGPIDSDVTRPLASEAVAGRERSRSQLLLAALVIVGLTLGMPHPGKVHGVAAGLVLAVTAATWGASLVRVFWPVLNRVGGVLLTAEIMGLVAVTGGVRSPYNVLYAMLLLYAAVFYGTRRLLLTGVVVAVAAAAPYLSSRSPDLASERTELLVRLAVWAITCVVVHGLVRQLRALTRQLAEQEQRYRSLVDHNPDAVYSMDPAGRFTSANAAGCHLVGYSADELRGQPYEMLLAPEDVPGIRDRFSAGLMRNPQSYQTRIIDRHGHPIDVAVSNLPIVVDGQVLGVYWIAKDISPLVALQDALERQALHDPLTGLANRSLLADRVEHALAGGERAGEHIAVLMLDLDGFKQVNDTFGHAAGDALLQQVAARLRRCSRPGDTLARLGGDEFALVLPGTDDVQAVQVADRILAELCAPMSVEDGQATVGSSIGIAVGVGDGARAGELFAQADEALYAAKRAGRGRWEVFHAGLRRPSAEALSGVRVDDARAWAGYMNALRADIAERKDLGELPSGTRAPATLHRTLEQLLAAIEALPREAAKADLALPERSELEVFIFHQSAVQPWADALARDGTLRTHRPAAADWFWAQLQAAITSPATVVGME